MRRGGRGPYIWLCFALLSTTSCAADLVKQAQDSLVGQPWSVVAACVGVPSKTLVLDETTTIVEWEYSKAATSGSVSLAALAAAITPIVAVPADILSGGSISISGSGNCKAVGSLSDRHLTSLKLSGDNRTLFSGRAGVCEPLFRGCLP